MAKKRARVVSNKEFAKRTRKKGMVQCENPTTAPAWYGREKKLAKVGYNIVSRIRKEKKVEFLEEIKGIADTTLQVAEEVAIELGITVERRAARVWLPEKFDDTFYPDAAHSSILDTYRRTISVD